MANKTTETVRIKLFKDSGKYKDDFTYGLNGKIGKIQRGVETEVPRAVFEIIDHSEIQDMATSNMITGLENEFKAKQDSLT